MAYRLYRRDPVSSGSWYYAVPCQGCGKPLYLLDDNSNGSAPKKIVGDGQISAPCNRCGHEGLYPATDLKPVQSTEDLDGARPARVEISKSPRKPLLRTNSNAVVTFGVGYIEDRPKAAAIVARIITSWADIEVQCARLLAELMGTNVPVSAAVFGSMRSSRTQQDALEAAAATVLNEKDYELFAAHMARKCSLEKERNDLAHGCFGVSGTIQESIVWVSQPDYLDFIASYQHDMKAMDRFKTKQFIYELGTLERISQEVEEFFNQLGFFRGYLSARHDQPSGGLFRAERYPQLCNQPHIRQALDRVRTAKKRGQVPPRGTPSARKR